MQSTMKRLMLGIAAAAFAFSMTNVSAQAKDNRIGDWKLNVAKSKYSPGPAPKSLDLKIEPAGKGVHVTTSQVNADGSTGATEYTANYDGKDNPIKGSPIADTVSMRRINATTTTRTDKKAGKVVLRIRSVISKDGKTYTVDVKTKTPKGEPVHNVLVFERS